MKLINTIIASAAAAQTTGLAHATASRIDISTRTQLRGGLREEEKPAVSSSPEHGPYHYKLSDQDWTPLASGQLKIAPKELGFNMQFAIVEFEAGGVRDLHWHRTAAEWVYVSKGSCEFTLMDDKNRYVTGVANVGDVWYFPLGWQHSIQAIDPDDGCTTLLWFDAVDGAGSINLSDMMAAYPDDIVKASLNGIPTEVTSTFPDRQNSVALGTIKDERIAPSDFPLNLWPVFPVDRGEISDSGEGGTEYAVRQEQLQIALSMSGGRIELEEGGMRELHWHTNADELHYVLSGCVRNIVHSNIKFPEEKPKEYTICAGDIGYVPLNFVHYLEAVDGPATVIVTFNHKSWGTQGLSGMMSVTPVHVTSSTLTTTEEVAEEFFPKKSTAFLRKRDGAVRGEKQETDGQYGTVDNQPHISGQEVLKED